MNNDILKVLAFFFVYGTPVYGQMHVGVDTGKGNLESYFVGKKGWTKYRLNKAFKKLRESGATTKEPSESDCKCYSVSGKEICKIFLLTL